MRIETLREYLEFGKYLNFSTAAKKLYISQPALSNHIANIEKELGVELVQRNQELELTAAGKVFFEGICKVLSEYDAVVEQVGSVIASGPYDSLTIKTGVGDDSFGSIRLAELTGLFKRSHPSISVKLVYSEKKSVIDELLSGVIDCALLFNYSANLESVDSPLLDFIVIDRAPITIVASKTHPLLTKTNLTFEDIQQYPYAMPAGVMFTEFLLSVRQLYRKHGFELKNVHLKTADSLSDFLFTGIDGDEIAILGPSPTLPKTMDFRSFEPEILQEFCLVYQRDNPNLALKAFLDFIKIQVDGQQPAPVGV
jgi:DNA-binding transcriptional LysR family regulator